MSGSFKGEKGMGRRGEGRRQLGAGKSVQLVKGGAEEKKGRGFAW